MATGGLRGGSPAAPAWSPAQMATLVKSGQGSNTGKIQPSPDIGRLRVCRVRIGAASRLFLSKFGKRSGTTLNSSRFHCLSPGKNCLSEGKGPNLSQLPGEFKMSPRKAYSPPLSQSLVECIHKKRPATCPHLRFAKPTFSTRQLANQVQCLRRTGLFATGRNGTPLCAALEAQAQDRLPNVVSSLDSGLLPALPSASRTHLGSHWAI
jgi:hypothetical protein